MPSPLVVGWYSEYLSDFEIRGQGTLESYDAHAKTVSFVSKTTVRHFMPSPVLWLRALLYGLRGP